MNFIIELRTRNTLVNDLSRRTLANLHDPVPYFVSGTGSIMANRTILPRAARTEAINRLLAPSDVFPQEAEQDDIAVEERC